MGTMKYTLNFIPEIKIYQKNVVRSVIKRFYIRSHLKNILRKIEIQLFKNMS